MGVVLKGNRPAGPCFLPRGAIVLKALRPGARLRYLVILTFSKSPAGLLSVDEANVLPVAGGT